MVYLGVIAAFGLLGNNFLNVGPTADGRIPQQSIDHLMELGKWMKINGEAIYGTMPWRVFRDDTDQANVHYTRKGNTLYAIAMNANGAELALQDLGKTKFQDHSIASVSILGSEEKSQWKQTDDALVLPVLKTPPSPHATVYRIHLGLTPVTR